MRKPKYHFILVLIAVLPMVGLTQTDHEIRPKGLKTLWKERVRARMVSQLFTGYDLGEDHFHMVKLAVRPQVQVKLANNLRFTGILRFYGELLDKLEPGRPAQDAVSHASKRLLVGDRFELELREFYFDWNIGKKSALRLGKQQIVWGETDGLKLLDVVNPQNFREFMLEEMEDSRIPLWAVKAEFPVKDLDVELVWIPDLTYHDIPGFEAPFFPAALMPQIPEGVEVDWLDMDKPDRLIADADLGVKVSAFVKGWDLTLNYLYHYDDLPVLLREMDMGPNGVGKVRVQPKYERMHTLGGAFNNVFGPITLRGELAFHFGRPFMTSSMETTAGVGTSDQFMLAIGVDWLFNETMVSVQSFHDIIFKDIGAYNRNRYEPNMSFFVSQDLLHDDLKLEALLVQNLSHGDGMIRPKAGYYLLSNLQVMAGADLFYGTRNGQFGQFQDRSRIFVGLEWGL